MTSTRSTCQCNPAVACPRDSRARRKVARTRRVDVRTLPGPAVMAAAIDAIVTQQPASKTYRVMTHQPSVSIRSSDSYRAPFSDLSHFSKSWPQEM